MDKEKLKKKKKTIIIIRRRSTLKHKKKAEEIEGKKKIKDEEILKGEKLKKEIRPLAPKEKDKEKKLETLGKQEKKAPYKKGVTYKKQYPKKDVEFEKEISLKKKPREEKQRISPKEIAITETITVGELAKKINIKANELIKKMMELGEMVTINQVIDAETAVLVAGEFNIKTKIVSLYEETKIVLEEEDKPTDYKPRPPIITIMGHVDHGKTLLLDAIRNSNIIDKEFGEITQHIGAYSVTVKFKNQEKKMTFLDTPGHEAFTAMRARGAQITDIVVIVIGADDGIMPQTVESINHAKDAKVPIIVVINKIDLPSVKNNIERIKQELAKHDLVVEEWGGDLMVIPLSAKTKENIDKLLEAVLLQAEMMELKANYEKMAGGVVMEASISKSMGPTATILITNGVLRNSLPFSVGIYSGKVKTMLDDWENNIEEAYPATPVLISGLDGVPSAGDPFQVVTSEKYARQISQKRKELKKEDVVKSIQKVTLANLYEQIKKGKIKELKLVLKADVEGSVEVLKNSLVELSNDEVQVKIVHSSTGEITETDILLASASNGIIIGFHIKLSKKIEEFAKKESVSIRLYRIIYDAIDDVKKALEGLLEPLIKEEGRGIAEIKQIFKISRIGNVLGCIVNEGKIINTDSARIIRDEKIIFDGKIESLKRFKNEVKEVDSGMECGLYLGEELRDVKVGDVVESYSLVKLKRTL